MPEPLYSGNQVDYRDGRIANLVQVIGLDGTVVGAGSYIGTSSTIKPTTDISEGATFVETDTGIVWVWSSGGWIVRNDTVSKALEGISDLLELILREITLQRQGLVATGTAEDLEGEL